MRSIVMALSLLLQPIAAQQDMPEECMAIVMSDPATAQANMNDAAKMGKARACMDAQKETFESHVLGDGKCTQAELVAEAPPCNDPACLAAVKSEVPKAVDQCMPSSDWPVLNPLFKCLLNHADDDCSSGAASIMAFQKLPAFMKGATSLAVKVSTRQAKLVKPVALQQDMPEECMAIVMSDPATAQANVNDAAKMGKARACMDAQKETFESHVLGDGKCTQEELVAEAPPCNDPACLAAVKSEVPKAVDQCMPSSDWPVLNPLFKCLLNHADDDCSSGAASIMAFQKLPAFMTGASTMALMVTRQAPSSNNMQTWSLVTMLLAGFAGGVIGAGLMVVFTKRLSSRRGIQQQPLLA